MASGLALASSDTGTLLVGSISEPCAHGIQVYYGYASDWIGSYSPTGLTGGKTVSVIYDFEQICPPTANLSRLSILGFSSNPGSTWLTSITCNGVTNDGTTAGFSYDSGQATWIWGQKFGLDTKGGSNVSCTIVHN